jgi:hypothetical protein
MGQARIELDPVTKKRLVEIAEGVYVEADVMGIVARIQEYDPNLKVKFLGHGGDAGDAPYKLVELCPDGLERVVFDIWELDNRILDRIMAADNARGLVIEGVEKANAKARIDMTRRYRESMDEANDIVKTFLKSKTKSKWTVKDGDRLVTIEDR